MIVEANKSKVPAETPTEEPSGLPTARPMDPTEELTVTEKPPGAPTQGLSTSTPPTRGAMLIAQFA